jgi:hypothetical protein
MKLRTSVAAAGATALVASGAFMLPAFASAHGAAANHTLKFISVTKKQISLTGTSVAIQDTDTNKAGKVIGFDEIYGWQTSATTSGGDTAVVLKGGVLYGTFTISLVTGAITNGKVVGGTGIFKGARGSFTATDISSTKTAITVSYHT